MVYCSQITDLFIVLSIYSNLFYPSWVFFFSFVGVGVVGGGERRGDRLGRILYLQNYPHISKLTGL